MKNKKYKDIDKNKRCLSYKDVMELADQIPLFSENETTELPGPIISKEEIDNIIKSHIR